MTFTVSVRNRESYLESIEEAEERRTKSKHDDNSYRISHGFNWINLDCMKANDNANKLLKKLSV